MNIGVFGLGDDTQITRADDLNLDRMSRFYIGWAVVVFIFSPFLLIFLF